MKYRPLGNTGLEISEISFGCGPNAGLMVHGSLEERKTVVARALELGVNYFDTASAYGDGLSETNLGEVLHILKAKPIIGSKVVLQANDLDDIQKAVIDSVEQSLKRLRVDCIDLIQLHNRVTTQRESFSYDIGVGPMLTLEEVLGPKGILETLGTLQKQGKVCYFGFTAFGGEVPAIYQLIDCNRFHTINADYNLLNPSAASEVPVSFKESNYGQVIPRAAKNNMGVLVIRVLAGGALSGSDTIHPLSRNSKFNTDRLLKSDQVKALRFLIQEGQTLPQAATKFALMNPDVSSVIGGFSSMTQLEEAVTCSGSSGLDDQSLELIDNLHKTNFQSSQ